MSKIAILVLNQAPISAVAWGPKNRTNWGIPVFGKKPVKSIELQTEIIGFIFAFSKVVHKESPKKEI